MDIASFLLDKVLPPVLAGAGGVATTIWRVTKGLKDKIEEVERQLNKLKEDNTREHGELKKESTDLKSDLEKAVEQFKKDVDKEIDEIYAALKARSKEQADLRRLVNKTQERYLTIEQRVEHCEKTINELNQEMTNYIKEQQEQWQATSRALGQIEGYLRATTRRPSGSFPGTNT